jgi:hypothetical protein
MSFTATLGDESVMNPKQARAAVEEITRHGVGTAECPIPGLPA